MKSYLKHLVAFLLSSLLVGLSYADGEEAKAPAVPPTVTVSDTRMTEIIDQVAISGTLVAGEEVFVNTRINGYAIEALNVDIGDRVKKGDVLAVLDTMILQSQVLQAEADLARTKAAIVQSESQVTAARATNREAQLNLNRSKRLRRSGHISQQDLDRATTSENSSRANLKSVESALNVSKAQKKQSILQLDIAKNNLKRASVRAPVSGVISSRNAHLGDIASAGGLPLFKIIKDGVVEMEAEVIETALGLVNNGQKVALEIAGVGDVEGSVRLISPTVDARTRLAKVRISLPSKANIRPGLSASGWILSKSRLALTVPASAVTTEEGKVVVSLVKDGVVEKRAVIVRALSRSGQREIVSGLALGDSVVTKSGVFFRTGDKVKVIRSGDLTGDAQ